MVYSRFKKQRILQLYLSKNLRAPTITKIMEEEGMIVSRRGVLKFLKRYIVTGTIAHQHGSGRPLLVIEEIKQIVEVQMRLDDEMTAYQLHALLNQQGFPLYLRIILRCRTSLGWTFRGMVNKVNLYT